jgi:hypothetical protein
MVSTIFGHGLNGVLPVSIRRQGGRSEVSFRLPGDLTIAEVRRVSRFCESLGRERGGEFDGDFQSVMNSDGKVVPNFVARISVWGRHENGVCSEVLSSLPRVLRSSLVPVLHV